MHGTMNIKIFTVACGSVRIVAQGDRFEGNAA